MSQAGEINTAAGPVPPTVATQYTTDNGTAVPALNILDIRGIDSSSAFVSPNTNSGNNNNVNGIVVIGGATQTGASNRVDVQLTNRIHGSAITTDGATPQALFMFDLGSTAGSFLFVNYLTFYDPVDGIGGSIVAYAYATTNGTFVPAAPNIAGAFDAFDPGLGGVVFDMSFPGGFPNNYVPQVTGVAGKTINFKLITTYTFVS